MAALNSFRTFAAVAYNELLLNSKRVAPYVMAMLCAGNALLWWGWGPAISRGWSTNSDYFIAGILPGFSFMTLPLFTAVIMTDPVIRDFRAGIDPLIFSKPVSRAEYLLGKFCGSFFTLTCCQSAFVVMLFVLQAVPKKGMIVQEAKFFLYPKHFVVFVVISHLFLGAFYFTVGTLTRNAKLVYGLGVAFYPVYITYQTAFDDGGKLQTRADVYGLDRDVLKELHSDHRNSDVPIARNYNSTSKPVRSARTGTQNGRYAGDPGYTTWDSFGPRPSNRGAFGAFGPFGRW